MQRNVFGEKLIVCSSEPVTGFYRDGNCQTDEEDRGLHTVCAVMTDEFLTFSKQEGNDLSTPIPAYNFPGLKAGDCWCLCVRRWLEAYIIGKALKVVLEATHEKTLDLVPLEELVKFAWKNP